MRLAYYWWYKQNKIVQGQAYMPARDRETSVWDINSSEFFPGPCIIFVWRKRRDDRVFTLGVSFVV